MLLNLLFVFLITAAVLHKYGNWRSQNVLVTLSTLISWYFAFVIIFLIPLDVVLTFYEQCKSSASTIIQNATSVNNTTLVTRHLIDSLADQNLQCRAPSVYISRQTFLSLWGFVYWTSQCLTWLILPIMQSYCKMGEFSVLGRLKASVVENAIYYASFAVLFVIFLVYIAAQKVPMNFANLKTICITASNTWGLFFLVMLLGYGLVEIPRQFWRQSFVKGYALQKTYFDLEKLSTDRNDAEETVRETHREAKAAVESLSDQPHLRRLAEIIVQKFPEPTSSTGRRQAASSSTYRVSAAESSAPWLRDEPGLAVLHRRVKAALDAQRRCDAQWRALTHRALHLEDVADNERAATRTFRRSTLRPRGFLESLVCSPEIEWYWECVVKRYLFKALAAFLALMSVLIVWSEVTFFSPRPVLSVAAIFVHLAAESFSYDYIEVSSIITIAYLCICAYYTVFRIKIYRYYHLDAHHNSDENSLLFSAILFCRLTPPMCLNFLGLIHLDNHVTRAAMTVETAYTTFMGHMDVVPFIAKGFNVYFPIGVLVFCLATYFRLATRCLHFIGVEQFIADDVMTAELVQGGKALVAAERNRLQRMSERESREEFWREKLADHDPSRPLRRSQDSNKRSFPGGSVASTMESSSANPNYGDRAAIVEHAEPMATVTPIGDDASIVDANDWFSGSGGRSGPTTASYSSRSGASQNPQRGIFDDL